MYVCACERERACVGVPRHLSACVLSCTARIATPVIYVHDFAVLLQVVSQLAPVEGVPNVKPVLGDAGLIEDLVSIAKAVDMTAAKAPFASTMKAAPATAGSVAPDSASPTAVTPLSSLECVFGLIARLCEGCKANTARFRRAGGVPVLVACLAALSHRRSSQQTSNCYGSC